MLDKQYEILQSITQIQSIKDLEELRVDLLGKNGSLTNSMKDIANLSIEQKKDLGAKLNSLKNTVTLAIVEQKDFLVNKEIEQKLLNEKLDITQPIRTKKIGKIHPITQVTQEVINIFASLGFSMASGPEIEDDYHNFTALNIPENHPARQMHDTFYLNTESPINAKIKKSNHIGSLTWNGKNTGFVQLTDVPRLATVKKGDTIVTGAQSKIFRENIGIGTIEKIYIDYQTNFYTIDVKLFNDMTSLGHVYIIKNKDRDEINTLEKKTEKNE